MKSMKDLNLSQEIILTPNYNRDRVKVELMETVPHLKEIIEIEFLNESRFEQSWLVLEWMGQGEYAVRRYMRFLKMYNAEPQPWSVGGGGYLSLRDKDKDLQSAQLQFRNTLRSLTEGHI